MESRTSTRAYWYLLGALWLLPSVLVAGGALLPPDVNPDGQCTGLGFGCVPSPSDGMLMLGAFAAPILIGAGMLAAVVLALLRTWGAFARAPQVVQACAVVALFGGAAVVLVPLF